MNQAKSHGHWSVVVPGHSSIAEDLLQANLNFYRAFETGDLQAMTDTWHSSASPPVICVHPGRFPKVGLRNVLDSWEEMFANQDFDQRPINIRLREVHVRGLHPEDSVWLKSEEEMLREATTFPDVAGAPRIAWLTNVEIINGIHSVIATNGFQRDMDGNWKMIHRHGGMISA
ncbi:hypothetical protein CYMTET_26279 [Cymbomonas tetramitiformis]|uniref:SnoaL-like domain-containing protein n=1 Tax=Cymbomonas tetramitiformis TaxID=36881 RepID=A0AAE0FS08_9CHLO|nr:hypothetical protein CYMTET_26279 [Cymbomonas tetramitiformis]